MLSSSANREKGLAAPLPTLGIPQARNVSAIGRANRSAVLRAARWYVPTSRRQLSEITGLGSATIFSIVDELTSMGLLVEHGIGESTGGRRPMLYRFNPEAFFAVGVDVGGMGKLRVVLTDLDGRVLSRMISDLATDAPPQVVVQRIASATDQLVAEADIPGEKIRGVGVAMHGAIDLANGVVMSGGHRIWQNVPLAQLIRDKTGLPGHVVNQSSAISLGENWCGAGRDFRTFVCVNVGVNVGVGMILDGKLYTGATNMGGHLGHVTVDQNGPLCWCGKLGCLGMLAGGQAIVERAVRGLRLGASSSISSRVDGRLDQVTADVVAEQAVEGDPYSVQIIQDAGRYLGVVIAWLINVLNPQAVMVGGCVAPAGEVVLDAIRGAVAAQALEQVAENVQIIPVALGMDARAVGAAIVVLERQLTL